MTMSGEGTPAAQDDANLVPAAGIARKEASRKLNLADETARMDALGIIHEPFESGRARQIKHSSRL
jgi:hypothetical protein